MEITSKQQFLNFENLKNLHFSRKARMVKAAISTGEDDRLTFQMIVLHIW